MRGLCPSVPVRIAALYATGKLAASHGEFHAAVTRLHEAQALGGPRSGGLDRAQTAFAEGLFTVSRSEPGRVRDYFERTVELTDTEPGGRLTMSAPTLLGGRSASIGQPAATAR